MPKALTWMSIEENVVVPEEVKIWEVFEGKTLREVEKTSLNLERRLEDWLEEDISMLSKDLLVIGRQIRTDFGGIVDLLCLDSRGDLTIVELKRDKTPREITAQVLDYATWVKDLSHERITEIVNARLGEKDSLEDAFHRRFHTELPEVINENHHMLIVASGMDASSERIVHYLSDTYGVSINVVTFEYFRNAEGREFLARVFLIEPEQVEYKTRTIGGTKRTSSSTVDDICARADEEGIGEEFRKILHAAQRHDLYPRPYRNSVMYTPPMNRSRMLFTVWLKPYNQQGSMYLSPKAFSEFYPVDEETAASFLGPDGWREAYDDVEGFVAGLDRLFDSMENGQIDRGVHGNH
jgi:hypothetical protein